jgi:iron complex outermembrane recepter protein
VALAIDENAPAPQVWNAVFSGAGAICADPTNPARLTDHRCFNSQWVLGPYRSGATFTTISQVFNTTSRFPYRSASDLDIWGVSAIVEWHLLSNLSIKSISSYRKVTAFWTRDSDHSPATIVETNSDYQQNQHSQEFQLAGDNFDKRLNWVLGAYYSKSDGNHKDLVNLVDAVFLSGAVLDGKSYAGFGQATFEVLHGLNLTAGIRGTEDDKTFNNANQYVVDAGFLTGAPFNPDGSGLKNGDPLMGPLGQTATIKDRAWTPMGSLSYRWNPEILTYVSYSEGFKGGGFTQRVFPPFAFIPSFAPETSKTYEIGVKTDLLDRRLRVNAAAFVNNYSNLQITVNDPKLGFAPIIQNAAKARISGFELEILAKPTDRLKIEGGLGYLDAKYTQVDIRALSSGVSSSTRLQNAPKWTLSSSVYYDFLIANAGMITPRVDWSYRSKVYNDAVNTPLLVQNGYHLVNAAVTYADSAQHWTLSAGVKNLTNKLYLVSGYADSFGGITEGIYGRPREWYLSGGYKF